MRLALLILGAVAALTGLWWMLQGAFALYPAGQMAGKLEWVYRGGATLLLGAALLAASFFVKRKPSAP